MDEKKKEKNAREAETGERGFITEFLFFLKHNKKWWLIPVIITLLMIGSLVILGGTSVAPFIYTLF
jgi:hypothetical protein